MRRITALLGLIALLVGSIAPPAGALDYDPDQARPWTSEAQPNGDEDPFGAERPVGQEQRTDGTWTFELWLSGFMIDVIIDFWTPHNEYRHHTFTRPSDSADRGSSVSSGN